MAMVATTQVTAAAAVAMAAATRDTRTAASGTKNNGDVIRGLVPLSIT